MLGGETAKPLFEDITSIGVDGTLDLMEKVTSHASSMINRSLILILILILGIRE